MGKEKAQESESTAQEGKDKAPAIAGRVGAFVAQARSIHSLNWVAGAVVVFLVPFAYQILIEFIRMGSVSACLEYSWNHKTMMLIGWVMLVLAFGAFTLATARPWITNFVFGAVLVLAGCVNYFKLAYRDEPLLPKDILQAGEGAQIATKLSLGLTREMWVAIVFWLLLTLLMVPFRLPLAKGWKSVVARIVLPAVCVACMPLYLFFYIGDKEAMAAKGVEMHPISVADSYYRGSFVTSYLYLAANVWQEKPAGYGKNEMETLAAQLPEGTGTRQPDIIVVLLESMFDVEAIEGTTYSEPLLANYERLAQEGISGQMLSSRRGGGTSDLEFSILGSFANQLLPVGSVPMIEYVQEDLCSLPWYCAQNGYRTVAIHPYIRSFYNRPAAYADMAIEEYYSLEDFPEGRTAGTYVSDEALAERIITEYEKSAAVDENVFIHAVTMQNHMPYTPDVYAEEYRVQASSGMGPEYDAILSTYATGVRDMDAMMGQLCEYFRTVDRDVVLLFFGDHQSEVGDGAYADLFIETEAYRTADAGQQWRMTHVTPYLMWANYAQPGKDAGLLAPYMLVPTLLAGYDVQGPAYYAWLAQTGDAGVSGGYYIQPDGTLLTEPSAAQQKILAMQALFQYDILFGRRYAQGQMYG